MARPFRHVRCNPRESVIFAVSKKSERFFSEKYDGYAVLGILKCSERHNEALSIIQKTGLPKSLLVDNELAPGYVRLNVPTKRLINDIKVTINSEGCPNSIAITEAQKQSLERVYLMYEKDEVKFGKAKQLFLSKWNKYPHLKILSEWWDSIPISFSILPVGEVLERTNAQRFDTSLPELESQEI